ncbi:MAG: ABC transporter substrate-binding protein [Candidatus Pristimantibacillus lignocellulolyticus]|uniref:ABC transporter substrate-binding protein n=1 Tax=Candidatus Pristimantibacillus lignocellulolyticus TaxID=2994561 RepID=A0A9J6ZE81_9BACL|nr:MAG: ABC transporter substrate-binding protein [Candidatus Pristimantibacillus lignocellulolyticus]
MKQSMTILALSLLLFMAACSDGGNNTNRTDQNNNANTNVELTAEERKALNEAVGEITYITGFYYAASPPDIEVVLADELGYFDELGLNVKIIPGLDAEGMKFLAANKAQIASSGTPSQVIQAVSNGAGISGIATFGAEGTSALLVMNDSGIYKPADLKGKTIGYHGALPANLIAMLQYNGMDASDVKGVSVGYDPTILASGQIDALTVYKSNEPYQMELLGHDVRVIDPGEFGAETSFGVLAVNNEFAAANPATVEDFLRAVAKAHEYAIANIDESIAVLAARSDSVYDIPTETNRWKVESELLEKAKDTAHGIGWQTDEQWNREIKMLFDAKVIAKQLTVDEVMNNSYIDAIYKGTELIWPQ